MTVKLETVLRMKDNGEDVFSLEDLVRQSIGSTQSNPQSISWIGKGGVLEPQFPWHLILYMYPYFDGLQ